ncbi:MAG: IS200/IS605 family transposase [Ignavibacteriales bacterium]
MPYAKIWIHAIWSTKQRQRIIHSTLREELLGHIREYSDKNNIHLDYLNCVQDHIHLLLSLNPNQSLAMCIKLIKGESSHWVNTKGLIHGRFEWQEEYIAISISDSDTARVREYIADQENHHRRRTFQEEYDEFIRDYGLLSR